MVADAPRDEQRTPARARPVEGKALARAERHHRAAAAPGVFRPGATGLIPVFAPGSHHHLPASIEAAADLAGLAANLSRHLEDAPEEVARMCVELVGGALVELERVRADLDKWQVVAAERDTALARADAAARAIRRAVELAARVAENRIGAARPTTRRDMRVSPAPEASTFDEVELPVTSTAHERAALAAEERVDEVLAQGALDDTPVVVVGPPRALVVSASGEHAAIARSCVELAGAALIEAELLRSHLDKWRTVAEERARSLDRVDAALATVASAVEHSSGITQAAAGLALVAPRWRAVPTEARPAAPSASTHAVRPESDDTQAERPVDFGSDLRERARARVEASRAELAAGRRSKWGSS